MVLKINSTNSWDEKFFWKEFSRKPSWMRVSIMDDIPYNFTDYLDLVDSTGRAILANKRGFIPADLPPILNRLGFDETTWLDELDQFKFERKKAAMIYIHVNPTTCHLRCSNLILSNLVARCNN